MANFGDQERLFGNDEQERIAEENRRATDDYERRVNDYNSRPLPDDWNGALHQQVEEQRAQMQQMRNAAMAERMNASRGVLDGYVKAGLQLQRQSAAQQSARDDHIASMMKLAASNGGAIPKYVLPGLNAALGLDGKTEAIYGGGFAKDGSRFGLMIAQKDPQTGEVRQAPMVEFDREGMYRLMLSKPGIFSRNEVQALHDRLSEDYTKKYAGQRKLADIPADWGQVGDVGVGNRTETGGTAVPSTWLYGPRQNSRISAFGANGRGGFTQHYSGPETGGQRISVDSGTRAADDKGRWKVLSSGSHGDGRQGTRYENDRTGEVIFVPEGQTIESVTRSVSDKERIAAARDKTNLEIARLSEAGRDRRNDANLQQKRMELAGKLVLDYAKLKSTSASDVNMARSIPEAAWKALFAPKVMRNEDGSIAFDEATGKPMTEPLGEEEVFKRMKLAGDWMKENFGRSDGQSSVDGLLNFIRSVTGEAETVQPQGAATQGAQPAAQTAQGGGLPPAQSLVNGGAQTQTAPQGAAVPQGNRTLEELLRKRGYDPAKIAAAARGGERTPSQETQKPRLSREEALAAEEGRRARNGRKTEVRQGRKRRSARLAPQSLETSSNSNAVQPAENALPETGRRYDEAPMLPEDRRAEIEKRYKEWQWQRRQVGDDISDEEVQRLTDEELNRVIGK